MPVPTHPPLNPFYHFWCTPGPAVLSLPKAALWFFLVDGSWGLWSCFGCVEARLTACWVRLRPPSGKLGLHASPAMSCTCHSNQCPYITYTQILIGGLPWGTQPKTVGIRSEQNPEKGSIPYTYTAIQEESDVFSLFDNILMLKGSIILYLIGSQYKYVCLYARVIRKVD